MPRTYLGVSGNALSILQLFLIVAPAFILFGYNQANIGGYLEESDWVKTFPEIDTVNSTGSEKSRKSTLQGFVVATFTIGALVGSLSCSYTGDKFGRRNVIFAGGLATLIGEVLQGSAFSLAQFIVGRVLIGFGVGCLSSIVPVWQSETSGAKNRGKHVVLDGLFICVGYTLESWINLGFFEFVDGMITWRPPICLAIIFSLMLCFSVYFFPESPRWLVMKGRSEQARSIVASFRGHEEDAVEVVAEVSGIEHSLEETKVSGSKLTDMMTMGKDKLLYRFALCILLQFYQQMSGSNLISVYVPILFKKNIGLSAELSKILAAGAMTWKFLSSFIAFVAIDRFGRRAVFMISGIGMCCCMTALAITTSMDKENKPAMIIAGCFIYLFNTFVPIGFLGANFLYCTEVAPLRLRMAMSSISTANHWLWNFVVVMITPVAIDTISWRYFIVFAAVGACIPLSVYFFFPETMGRSLEEIETLFTEAPSAMATVKLAKQPPAPVIPVEAKKMEQAVHHEEP
ncbi:hypothetical protein V2G26_007708 [Clonostachys chloroleuca]|uniref:Major facilitator superfamily (MFS) profile domain-containing protein n=1 Tax=Clonostachys chloroleuca TaxID=1926264 RepID=A0AA35MD13_9HYPO|nr:unnamed protein product [Clonostachys chloroleuca]